MTRPNLFRLFSALVCFVSSTAFTQQYTIKKIVFDGPTPYSQASLEAASGLKVGDSISKTDLQAASQRLVDTGAFDEMQSTVDGPIKSVSVIFKLKAVDPSRLLTTGFENFVWYQPAELVAELQKRVPLFNGTVPEAGNQQDAIVAALQQMLSEKNIAAKVSEEPLAPSPAQPLRVAEFRVDSPSVQIHSVTLAGVTPPFAAATDKMVHQLTGARYNEGLSPTNISNILLAAYRDAGYQASSLDSLTRTVVSSTPSRVDIDVSATIKPGDVYLLSKLDWPGSPIMSTSDFNAAAKLHPGDVASRKALIESLGNLATAYRSKGYIDVSASALPALDTATHQVAFTIAANAGAQYTLRSISSQNLSDAQKKDFDRAWILHPGDVYNETYVTGFLKNNTALLSLAGSSLAFKTVADPDTHTVDLILTFAHAGR